MGDAKTSFIMKFPHFHRPKLDLHSLGVQTALELTAGGLFTVLLIRWVQM
jgi:hypothetical protein